MNTTHPIVRRIAAAALVVTGIALIPLPGPGTALVVAGLALAGVRPPSLRRLHGWTPAALQTATMRVTNATARDVTAVA